MVRSVTFGILCGTTAALSAVTAGGGFLLTFASYSLFGSLATLAMALTALR
jgi:hypothetical protein